MARQRSSRRTSFAALMLLLACLRADFAHGMDCSFGTSSNPLEKFLRSCPQIHQSSEKSYCCYDLANESQYCCDVWEFYLKTGLGVIVPVVITSAIIISLIVCCLSCLCCSCCPWYRRRHQGTVYGKVQSPSVIHVIQTPANVPPSYTNQPSQNQYNATYPTSSTGMPQPPPQYTNEAYSKQAPYNPNYPQ